MTNFGGAFDLSSLNKEASGNQVTELLVRADQNLLRQYVELSDRVPVLLFISDPSSESESLRQLLLQVLQGSEGRFAAAELSLTDSPQLAQAVGVSMAPAMLALLAGKPAPLFQGEVSQEQLLQVLGQVLQLAAQNNITGRVNTASQPEPAKPLSPEHERAFAAIEAGDLAGAKEQYQSILTEYPNDLEAAAGLAQVELMIRLRSEPASELDKLLAPADQLMAQGNPAGAFDYLLDAFAQQIDQRDQIRMRLLELFSLLGDSDAAVLSARRRLASLMF